MPRRPTRSVPTVLLHGINGSLDGHWQRWLAEELTSAGREVRFPDLPDSDAPQLEPWLAALDATLTGLPDDGYDLIGHSLGAALWLHATSRSTGAGSQHPRPARVALVAPPASDVLVDFAPEFTPVPLDIDAVRAAADGTVLVGGDDDQYCPGGAARVFGAPLKIATTMIAGGGHLNIDAGYGPWPAVLDWCGRDNLAFIA